MSHGTDNDETSTPRDLDNPQHDGEVQGPGLWQQFLHAVVTVHLRRVLHPRMIGKLERSNDTFLSRGCCDTDGECEHTPRLGVLCDAETAHSETRASCLESVMYQILQILRTHFGLQCGDRSRER